MFEAKCSELLTNVIYQAKCQNIVSTLRGERNGLITYRALYLGSKTGSIPRLDIQAQYPGWIRRLDAQAGDAGSTRRLRTKLNSQVDSNNMLID